jgi:uncharacterized membrane protein YfcA
VKEKLVNLDVGWEIQISQISHWLRYVSLKTRFHSFVHTLLGEGIQNMSKSTESVEGIDRRLGRLVIPWALIAIVSIGATLACFPFESATNNTSDYDTRYLEGEEVFGDYFDFEQPVVATQKRYYEEHHDHLFPLTTKDAIGFACAIVGLMIAAGGGIGGGGILVPIYILVMGFSPKHAIPLSNITILGGAIANMFLNIPKKHPLTDRPLVDWDLILVMEPLTVAGALIGAFLNNIIPEKVLAVMLVALLSFTAHNTLKKAIKMYNKESAGMSEKQSRQNLEEGSGLIRTENWDKTSYQSVATGDEDGAEENGNSAELERILEAERRAPIKNITILIVMSVVILIINLGKGGGAVSSPLGIECGSRAYWIANGIMLAWILAITFYVRYYLEQCYERKKRVGYKYVEGDIEWDRRALTVYPSICSLAGFFAGMFGVGGGIVKGPLMLEMGV